MVISRHGHPTIAFELLATATNKELNELYGQALVYTENYLQTKHGLFILPVVRPQSCLRAGQLQNH